MIPMLGGWLAFVHQVACLVVKSHPSTASGWSGPLICSIVNVFLVRPVRVRVLTCFLPQALREVVPLAERATQAVYPSPLLSPLEYKVRKLLEHLVEKEHITGCQV